MKQQEEKLKQVEESKQLKQIISQRTSEQKNEVEALRESNFLDESRGKMRSQEKIVGKPKRN